jgi:magnesium transporter
MAHDGSEKANEGGEGLGVEAPAQTVIRELSEAESQEERLSLLLQSDADAGTLAREIEGQEPPDAADALESLQPASSVEVLHEMDRAAAAEALSYMEAPLAETVLADLPDEEAGELLALMDPDDAADLLQLMEKGRADAVLATMPRRRAASLGKLALYDPETAGGIMNTDYLWLDAEGSVGDAIEVIRQRPHKLEDAEIYCLDRGKRLAGLVELRALLVNPPDTKIEEVMERQVEAIRPEIDREEVAMAFDRYDYLSLPVIDGASRMLGVVTIDDVVDIIREEHTEDAYKQVGAGAGERISDSLGKKLRGRFPWLLINLLMATAAALVVLQFEGLIDEIAILAVIMPVIANQAGNAGHQSLAVTLRALVLGEIRASRVGPLVVRETLLGVVSGLLIGALVGGGLALLGLTGLHPEADWRLGLIAAAAMSGALAMGCLSGTGIPLILEKAGFDPATGSAIFVTVLTDVVAFATFLGLAAAGQAWLLGEAPALPG